MREMRLRSEDAEEEEEEDSVDLLAALSIALTSESLPALPVTNVITFVDDEPLDSLTGTVGP